MSLRKTPLSVWEKLDFIPAIFRISSAAFLAAIRAPFRSVNTPKAFKTHVILSASRAAFSRLSNRQSKFLSDSTKASYLSWVEKNGFQSENVVLKDGTNVFWIGRPSAENIVLYFHGGGWSLSAGQAQLELGASTVRKAEAEGKSLSVLVVQYSLSPTYQYPTQISQCVEALDYILNTLGKDPSKVMMLGDSAGGTTVMSVFSHILHPHPDIKPLKLASPLKSAVTLSPWLDFEMSSSWILDNQLQDPVAPDIMRSWARDYLGDAPLDNYNQPAIAPAEWWAELPVEHLLITGGKREMLAEAIAVFGEKVKSVHASTTVFLAADDFHAQPCIGAEMGLGEGEQAGVIREWILRQVEQ